MPNMCVKRTGTLWMISTLAVGLVAGCGKEAGGGGGSGGSTNVERTGGSGGSRLSGGAGGSSSGTGGSSGGGSSSGGTTGGSGLTGGTGAGTGGSGTGTGGAGTGTGGSGSTGDAGPAANYNPPADKAVAKFCNGLVGENMMILEFALEIGMQPVRLVAKSGECFPVVNQPCAAIPVGPVTVKVIDMSNMSLLAMGDTTIMGGSQMIFFTDLDVMTMQPFLGVQRLKPEFNCAQIASEPAPTGPMPDGGTTPPPPRPPLMP
jgi:hypothetical protein